jgi:hypothetical protein
VGVLVLDDVDELLPDEELVADTEGEKDREEELVEDPEDEEELVDDPEDEEEGLLEEEDE